jgi:hypothetical protein
MFDFLKRLFGGKPTADPSGTGKRVWAPWEGQFLYSATVIHSDGDNASIRYDTGEERAELLSNLRPLEPEKQIERGQQIFMMYDREARSYMFYPAMVTGVRGEYFDVRREDGQNEQKVHVKRVRILESALPLRLEPEWTSLSFLRIKDPEQLADAPRRDGGQLYQANDRVLARWLDYYWYPAIVMAVGNDGYQVTYSDGDRGIVSEKHLMPLYCEEGERIFIRPPEEARLAYAPATVTRVENELLDVEFEENQLQERRQVSGLSINRARFWRLPKGSSPRSLDAGEQVLVLLGPHWYPGRVLPERGENELGPREDAVFVELLNAAQDVMVTPELIKPLRISVGDKVECSRGGASFVGGTITDIRGDKVRIKYS